MQPITIRPYAPQDWERLQAIHDPARQAELALAGLSDAFVPLSQAAENEGLFDYTVVVAELDGTPAGFAAYSDDELAWLYVDPNFQRCGVGRALVRHVTAQKRPLYIEVLVGNDPARALYESEGFRLTETLHGQMPGNEAFSVSAWALRFTP